MNTTTIIKTRGLFQITKIREGLWSCSLAIYGANKAFNSVSMSSEQIDNLMQACQLPLLSFIESNYLIEFVENVTEEALKKFGF